MSQQYYTLVTNIGAARIAKATALGTVVNLSQMAVGDGGGNPITPSATATALTREVYRASLNMLEVDGNNQKQVIAELLIPEEEGDFTIREVGLFDNNNNLIAIGSIADSYKPRLSSGTASQQIIRMVIQIDNTDAVGLKVDPAVVLATREFVEKTVNKKFGDVAYRVPSIAALREFNKPNASVVIVENYHEGIAGGGGVFIKQKNSNSADDGGYVIVSEDGARWERVENQIDAANYGFELEKIKSIKDKVIYLGANEKLNLGDAESIDPDLNIDGGGVVTWKNKNFSGYEMKKNIKTESIFLTPDSWHKASREGNAISPEYPPYSPPGRGDEITDTYNTVISWRSGLNKSDAKKSAVSAYGANIGVRAKDWKLTEAFGQDSMMFGVLSNRNTAIGSETMVWLGAPNRDYLIETNHDWYRNVKPDSWTAANNEIEAAMPGIGQEIYNYNNYPTNKDEAAFNVAVGRDGLLHLIRGTGNVGIGYQAGCQIMEGEENVAVGKLSLRNGVFANRNTAIGGAALKNGVKTSGQVAIGFKSAENAVTGAGGVIVGSEAATDSKTINDSIIIGPKAAKGLAQIENKLIIGKEAHQAIYYDLSSGKGGVNLKQGEAAHADFVIRAKSQDTGSGYSSPNTGLLVDSANSANIIIAGKNYANINLHQGDTLKGGFQYGFSTKNIAVLLGGKIMWRLYENGELLPNDDNVNNIGSGGKRLANIYAATAVINTSDRRLKQDIGAIPDEVIKAWREVDLIQYRWKEAVAEKSAGARYHTGLIAQSISEAFAKHGLDAQDYGLICYDQWPETPETPPTLDANGAILELGIEYQPAGERWGIRAEECLFIEAESNRRAIAELMKRIDKLEKNKKA